MTSLPLKVEPKRTVEQMLSTIIREEEKLKQRYQKALSINSDLDRALVSFQANKHEIGYRWCKYKEGFSAALIRYIFERLAISKGRLLDPFAGSGTALFIANEYGLDSVGIELLPCSAEMIEVRRLILESDRSELAKRLREFKRRRAWEKSGRTISFSHLRITEDAFPPETQRHLERYLWECVELADPLLARVLRFAVMCVLESISYTRKDGQYLRWDSRSGRRNGENNFNKGPILGFTEAVSSKINEIANDLDGTRGLYDSLVANNKARIELLTGSSLDLLPTLRSQSFDCAITSPPYCNRYDYTRTYALELAMMGVTEAGIRSLRQSLLSCTVENRPKVNLSEKVTESVYSEAMEAFSNQAVLAGILQYLEHCRDDGTINNSGIPRMVRGYFEELSIVIFEVARLLRPGAPFVMVNDNVQYMGIQIPVDLILSDIAAKAGLRTEAIWVLPRGKGNSSQQMGVHGRKELRKCVYIWRKIKEK